LITHSKKMMKYKFLFVGLLLGAIAGYLYWLKVGCASGTCMITSRPLNSTLYGAMMGALLGDMFRKK
jgi:phage shock protein E